VAELPLKSGVTVMGRREEINADVEVAAA